MRKGTEKLLNYALKGTVVLIGLFLFFFIWNKVLINPVLEATQKAREEMKIEEEQKVKETLKKHPFLICSSEKGLVLLKNYEVVKRSNYYYIAGENGIVFSLIDCEIVEKSEP